MTDRFAPFVLLVALLAPPLYAQAPSPVEEEAPESIFDQKIGDVGVVVDADGTWTTRLAAGWGQGFSPEGALAGLGYPGFEKGGVFSQQPDFSLTLRLLERYYLEVIYSGSLEDRAFLVGYQGQPGELLQWAKAGNTSFAVPPRAGQIVAEGRRGAPAAGLAATAGPVAFEAMGRYEDGARETRVFHGYRDTKASSVSLDQWTRNRFFKLPENSRPFTGITILVSDPAGKLGIAGSRLRPATQAEASTDQRTGEIRLAATAARRFVVTWDGAAAWSNAPTTLLGLQAESAADAGSAGTWFVLAQPGTASAFEQRNRYAVTKGTVEPILLFDEDSGAPVSGYQISQASTQDWFEVSGDAEAPFFEHAPGMYPASNVPPPASSTLGWSFRLPVPAATSYSLGTDLIASSLLVIRNGVPTSSFQFEASSGVLKFDSPIFETDVIEVSYQRTKTANKAADLLLWQGGRWDAAPGHNFEWALQGRWNMEKDRFTTEDLQSPGRMALSLAYEGTGGDWTWKIAATGGALLTDSTGHRRLYGFPSGETDARFEGNSLRPSALPKIPGVVLTESGRAALVFRNFWANDPLTGAPQASAWGNTGIGAEPSVTDGWIGPYIVRGDGIRDDRLAVIESTLKAGDWAAFQVYLDKGKPQNLQSSSAVSLTVRAPSGLGASRVFFQAGTVSENWDGTGAVRKMEYRSQPSLVFQDQTRGRRYFPIPEDSSWGNDADGDGAVSADGSLVTRELTGTEIGLDTASQGWQTVRFQLGDAERKILQRTTGWRLVVVQTAGEETKTVLTGPVVFEGSTWTVLAENAAPGTSVNPVEQTDAQDKTKQELRVDWTDRDRWALEARHSPLRPASYRTINFRYRLDAAGTTVLKLGVTDADGLGVTAEWTAASAGWVSGKIDLREKTLTLDGIPTGTVKLKSGAISWDRLTLTKTGTSSLGQLLLADIEAADPVWEPLGATELSTTWKQPRPWPSAQWPLLSGFSWSTHSSQSGLDSVTWRGQTTLAGSVGPLRTTGEASFLRTDSTQEGHGAYTATLPMSVPGGPSLELSDRFSDQGLRAEKATLTTPWLGAWIAQATAKGPPVSLDQDYSLAWSASVPSAADWNASVSARWFQSGPTDILLGTFADQWIDSWRWLPPTGKLAPFHLLEGLAGVNGSVGPVSMAFKGQNHVSQSLGPETKWSAWGDWDFRLPLRLAVDSWSLTPSLARSVEGVYAADTVRTPSSSAAAAARWLWTRPGSLGTIPFIEMLGTVPWSGETGFESGKAQSTVGLDWDRPPASDWTDLAVPAAAGTTFASTRGRDGTAGYSNEAVSVHLEAKSLNLWGQLGSQPIFSWYRTDVWTWAVVGRWADGTRTEDRSTEATLSARSELVLTTQESVGLPITYQGKWGAGPTQTAGIKPTWSLRHPADLPFELPRWLSPSAFKRQWVQNLSASVDLGWQPTPAPVVRDLLITWKGSLLLSEKSSLSLTTRWGQQWQDNLTVVGLEAALDLVLNF